MTGDNRGNGGRDGYHDGDDYFKPPEERGKKREKPDFFDLIPTDKVAEIEKQYGDQDVAQLINQIILNICLIAVFYAKQQKDRASIACRQHG